MTISDLSVRRPVLAAVASLLLIVFGLVALRDIPVRELPDVDNAVVTVSTTYRGAAPEVIDTDITETIEGAVAAISGIRSISSESRQGRSRVTIEFENGRDVDVAANDVRDAVGRVRGNLPDAADQPEVEKSDADADPVMRLAVVSDRLSTAEITDYIDRFIADRLATLNGVANLQVYGERSFAVRIWLDRRALAARNLTVADVQTALVRNNVELPAGEVTSRVRQLTVRLNSRLQSIEDFRDVVLDRVAGYAVRLGDVARVEPGVADDSTIARSDGRDAVGIAIQRQSQSNTLQISNAVRAEIDQLRPTLPEGMEILIGSDDALFVGASIREVVNALMISLGLVVLVILLFLRSVRATMIPAITIPVSLVGAFTLFAAWGFSLNTLTLLALLLAIGLVVDDAIVVLENIQRRIENGEPPLVAAMRGARQVTFAVLATSATLIAVFVPLSFMPGQVGRLFVEFGWVMAGTVAISTFVALTACPALASKILKSGAATVPDEGDGPRGPLQRAYAKLLGCAVRMPLVVLVVAGAITGGAALFYDALPRELAPREDRGVGFVPLTAPQGSTVEYTDGAARQVEEIIAPLREQGVVETVFTFTGWGNRAYRSFVVFRLAEWDQRDMSASEVAGSLAPEISQMTIARGFPITPAGLGLRGNSTPLRVVISGPDFESVQNWSTELLERAGEIEGLVNPEINYEQNLPQLDVQVDRARADDLGIPVEVIATTMQTMLASREVTTFVSRGREYPVIVQAEERDRSTPADIDNIYIRAGDGETLVPLGALVSVRENAASSSLRRFDRLPSIQLSGALAPGTDLGAVLEEVERVAAEVIPPEGKLGFEGQSRTFKDTSSGAATVFAMALLIVFLVLAAQFESFIAPVIILLTVPTAVAGAIYAMALGGLSLNVYSQIGIILLIGLVAKNGILIVEFANQLRDQGASVRDAAIRAAVLRLRPITMTVISTVLGALPLVVASGAGAESRSAIGTVIIAGLTMSAILMLVVTPVLYDLLARFSRPRGAVEQELERAFANEPAE
ncbi:efflux RND transporter permease subunit [Lutimaribacter sp. EGI FJ00015]|uniref:Efflux RND transporter permease subunit n=1 Tax=Lutimaribacter degradans TaxID=2945989 RepID=A0ACC5ZVG3_9RHOB|nr:efflux RND transporter permease subunit [Lutimaribacter sp. EGI FJ00013]MCM2562286.1 efflux RND transporter permease subunit [Lutimaribacter sp. EGI FJ00013]MCO0613441.1 efflux RND transporter permease subunit [Lutimaribacter sp. EGI FJ00015]MCO0636415.1 efflux RND transporter permease subunit [Lutimaribacter sp. EGI FJ00014]